MSYRHSCNLWFSHKLTDKRGEERDRTENRVLNFLITCLLLGVIMSVMYLLFDHPVIYLLIETEASIITPTMCK